MVGVVSIALVSRIDHTEDGLDTVRIVGAGALLSQPAHHTERPGQMFLQTLNDRQLSLLLRSVLEAGGIFVGRGWTEGLGGRIGRVLLVSVVQSAAVRSVVVVVVVVVV